MLCFVVAEFEERQLILWFGLTLKLLNPLLLKIKNKVLISIQDVC